MPTSATIPCDCCKLVKDGVCYDVTGWAASPIGSPGCFTNADLSIIRDRIELPIGFGRPTGEEVAACIVGAFVVDCSKEPSGFCRGKGKGGTYPWSSAVFEKVTDAHPAYTYTYLFEDCDLGDADLRVTVSILYIGECAREPT